MKFCFITANSITSKREDPPSISIGVFSLASILKEKGHKVTIVDLFLDAKKRKNNLSLSFYKKSIKHIKSEKADVFCFSADCYSLPLLIKISQLLKKSYPCKPVIFGGPATLSVDDQLMRAFPSIDFILRGETEESLPLLAIALSENNPFHQIPGLTWRSKNRKIRRNPDSPPIINLNKLGFPDYNIKPGLKSYIKEGLDYIRVESGRGCPFNCSFCSTSLFFKRKLRLRDPQKILSHIRQIKRSYGLKKILLAHDNSTLNKDHIKRLCDVLSKEKDISWIGGGRLEDIDRKTLKMLKNGHCCRMEIGIESGSENIQRKIHKNLNLQKLLPTLNLANKLGIEVHLSFIIGFPTESKEDINQTLKMMLSSSIRGALININVLVPNTGTELLKKYYHKLIFSGEKPILELPFFKQLLPIIKRFPLIFSAFYEYKTSYASPKLLYQLEEIYPYIIKFFPLSSFLAAKKVAPLGMFKDYILKHKIKKSSPPQYFIELFYNYSYHQYKKAKMEHVLPLLRYEYLVAKNTIAILSEKNDFRILHYKKIKRICSVNSLLNSIPYIAEKAFVSNCHFNMSKVLKKARKDPESLWTIKSSTKKSLFITLVIPDKKPYTIKLDKKKAICLKLANGKRTVRDIIRSLPSDFPKKKDLESEACNVIIGLLKIGFLSL